MCTAPNTLPNGQQTACRNCSECRNRAINDWVGRVLAETKTAMASHSVTLTYGRGANGDVDHPRAAILTYSDVQKYLKLLRRHGYPVRYLVAGEYGSKKGRAHWHIMLFWQKAVPDHVLDQNFMEQHWPHGFSFWQDPGPHAVRYICKYLQKDQADQERQAHLAMSKKPPIGSQYFRQLAEQYVEQGIAPQTLAYTFPEARYRDKQGEWKFVPFLLRGRSAELYLDHYVASWRKAYPGTHLPNSELVEEHIDPGSWKERADALKPFIEPDQPKHQNRPAGDSADWWFRYVNEAKDEQERQRRQAERDRYDDAQFVKQYAEFSEAYFDWEHYFAQQAPDSAGPGTDGTTGRPDALPRGGGEDGKPDQRIQ